MGIFSRKNDIAEQIQKLPPAAVEDLRQTLELVQTDRMNAAIEDSVKKAFSLTDFQVMDGGYGNDGGHFGTEFDLQATAARLKLLHATEPWVFATSSLIARTLSSVEFRVVDATSGDVLENHPLNDVVSGGNPVQDGIHKRWSGYLDLSLGGNYFEILDENYEYSMHVPVELAMPVYRKNETAADSQLIAELGPFEALEILDADTGRHSRRVPWEQVIHHKFPNPFNPFFGLSMYVAASRPILLARHKHEFEMAFYLRGATNAGVIETTEDITKSRMERLMATFEKAFTGKRNWWRTVFLPKGAKWVNAGLSMKEMDHMEGLRENRLALLAVLGIPPSQVGIVQDVNRATAETQETAMWQNTIVPMAMFIAAGYNNSPLVRDVYNNEIRVEPNFDGVEAIEGSLTTRAERAKSIDDIGTVNEQREIIGFDPLPASDPRGNMFASQIKKLDSSTTPTGGDDGGGERAVRTGGTVAASVGMASSDDRHTHVAEFDSVTGWGKTVITNGDVEDHTHTVKPRDGNPEILEIEPTTDDGHTHPDIDRTADRVRMVMRESKKNATANQRRIEKSQMQKLMVVLEQNRSDALAMARQALLGGKNVGPHLQAFAEERLEKYVENGLPVLAETMERGWDMHLAQTRSVVSALRRVRQKQSDRITPEDEQALNAIRERTADGRRRQLDQRNIDAFRGFDETQTEQIVQIVEDGLRDGKSFEQIAGTIRADHGERYGDQAFTIARTETLTAVSAGIKANNDALNQVYSKVDKQWFHVGDVGLNPDARAGHANFENVGRNGVVPSDYVWVNENTGARLQYPRDPSAGAGDVINCRCTMVSIIPDDAVSNARTLLR